MLRVILPLCLLLPLCSGCAFVCESLIDLAIPSPSYSFEEQRQMDELNAKYKAFEDDKKVLDEHPSKIWPR